MDSSKSKNPVYSNTDSGKVNISDEQWKKALPSDVYHIARVKRAGGTVHLKTGWNDKSAPTGF